MAFCISCCNILQSHPQYLSIGVSRKGNIHWDSRRSADGQGGSVLIQSGWFGGWILKMMLTRIAELDKASLATVCLWSSQSQSQDGVESHIIEVPARVSIQLRRTSIGKFSFGNKPNHYRLAGTDRPAPIISYQLRTVYNRNGSYVKITIIHTSKDLIL